MKNNETVETASTKKSRQVNQHMAGVRNPKNNNKENILENEKVTLCVFFINIHESSSESCLNLAEKDESVGESDIKACMSGH